MIGVVLWQWGLAFVAEKLDADVVIGIRLVTSNVATAAAELLAYGTAVKLVKD